MALIFHYFLCFLISLVLSTCGYGIDTWQWWVGCACVWIDFLCGREYESKK